MGKRNRLQSCKFFIRSLIFLPSDKLNDLIESYLRDGHALREQIADLCYHMRGGLEWDSAWGMCFEDRELMIRVINRRIKEENPAGKEYM